MSYEFTVPGGESRRFPVGGKYSPSDIIVHAQGTVLPELSNPGAAEDLMEGKELLGGGGEPVVGTFTLAQELAAQDELLAQISEALAGKVGGGGAEPDPTAGYTRLEYAASDGAAYVVTDFIADNTCGMEAVIAVGDYGSTATMGSVESGTDARYYLPYPLGSTTIYYGFNTAPKITATVAQSTPFRWQTNFLNSRLAGVYNADGASVGSIAITETLKTHTVPVAIFGLNRKADGGVTEAKKMTLYIARCSRGHEVVREYIPCRREADGVVGLFEKFTGTFLEPLGGTLTAGPDIDW